MVENNVCKITKGKIKMCKHCENTSNNVTEYQKIDSRTKTITWHFVAMGGGWGFHNQSQVVHDELKNVYRILKKTEEGGYVTTQPIEYCPKCGRKLVK